MAMAPWSMFISFGAYWALFFVGLFALGKGRLAWEVLLFFAGLLALGYVAFSPKRSYRIRWLRLGLFVPFFFYYSFLGALGVARLALRPVVYCEPHKHTLKLRGTPSTNAITANIFSLMPGTLSIKIDQNILTLHVIDTSLFNPELIAHTHAKIEALFDMQPRET
jgi:multisubunit Na+/H+ antiporter MnhE subunit